MTIQPRDIVVWGQYRSGSTNMCYRLVYGIKWLGEPIPGQRLARFLGEATGRVGTVGSGWRGVAREITEHLEHKLYEKDSKSSLLMPYSSWQKDDQGNMERRDAFGDPFDEILHRLRVIKEGDWQNPVVFKHMGWPKFLEHQSKTSEAMITSKKDLYHVCTWRGNLFDWMCSHYVIRKRDGSGFNPHGTYEWDGNHFGIINKEVKENFLKSSAGLLDNFRTLIQDMPKDKSVMVETKDINRIEKMHWPNGAALPLPSKQQLENAFKEKETGENIYLHNGQRIRAADMIEPNLLETFWQWSKEQEKRLDWTNLPSQIGIKVQPG